MPINIGYEHFVMSNEVDGFVKTDSASIKKLRQDSAEKGRLILATSGHKTRSAIVMKSGWICLSSLQTTTIERRIKKAKSKYRDQNDDDQLL